MMTIVRASLIVPMLCVLTNAPARAEEVLPGSGIRFIEDDYPAALALARSVNKPLLVDTWASWCHTCLSMKRTVFTDAGLRSVKDSVVWLAIDGENLKNRAFLDKFPLDAWPTFHLINPTDEQIIGRWVGAASVNDFRAFVQGGVLQMQAKQPANAAAVEMRKGYAARSKGDHTSATQFYRKAVELTPLTDSSRPARLSLLAISMWRGASSETASRECVRLGLTETDHTGNSSLAADFAIITMTCADRLPKGDADATALRKRSLALFQRLLADEKAPLSADDRSDIYDNVISLLDSFEQHDQAVAEAKKRVQFLEDAAAKNPTPEYASTYDAQRTDTYLYLGEPEKAERLLAQRENEMPEDYNPPARLARVLFEQKRLPEAEAAIDRALSKMTQGQRRLSILTLKGRILEAAKKSTVAVVQEQLDVYRGLPTSQRKAETEADLMKKLEKAKATAQ